ncbi:hypothetical protein [Ruegeria halocynthiae]|uniref:hypothetical protein n=1 Tax=Ruegeria halocynthiae TaxID=985054 RepID=UPI0005686146|nr:hypothetical protein [Ruegeria halocynthiae]
MTAIPFTEKPSSETVQTLEKRIEVGDVDAMKKYTADAFQYHLANHDELHRRRMILGRLDTEISTPIECFALVSAAMEDRKAWDLAIRRLGENCDPGLGYLAWRLIHYYSKDKERADKWMNAVKHSARLGHFPSRRQVLLRELRHAGFVSGLKLRRRLFTLERERLRLARADPSSRLLARYTDVSKYT